MKKCDNCNTDKFVGTIFYPTLCIPCIIKLRKKPNFVKITKAGFYEGMVHNIDEVKKDSEL